MRVCGLFVDTTVGQDVSNDRTFIDITQGGLMTFTIMRDRDLRLLNALSENAGNWSGHAVLSITYIPSSNEELEETGLHGYVRAINFRHFASCRSYTLFARRSGWEETD